MALADYIYQKPVTETERLRIRPMRAADVLALTEWMPDPSILYLLGQRPEQGGKEPGAAVRKRRKTDKKSSSVDCVERYGSGHRRHLGLFD